MAVTLQAGMVVAGRFRLERELGRGGMGAVWLARHESLEVPCALKFIVESSANTTTVRQRFEREAKAAALLRSPHVVHILDYGVWDDVPYLAMEYLEGEDLGARLESRGRLSPAETYYIVAQLSRALTKAHAAGIVHRDLKPENIFLVQDDGAELVKVLDFGIAKQVTPTIHDGTTKTGAIVGTPFYVSPEQARGIKQVDHRSDLWSVAVVVYRCLTGALPFYSEALGDLLIKIMTQKPPVPSAVRPELGPAFDAWWEKAIALEPEARFQSARELADGLAQAFNLDVERGGRAPRGSEPSLPDFVRTPMPSDVGLTPLGAEARAAGSNKLADTMPDASSSAPEWGAGASSSGAVAGSSGKFGLGATDQTAAASIHEEAEAIPTRNPWPAWLFLATLIIGGAGGIVFLMFESVRRDRAEAAATAPTITTIDTADINSLANALASQAPLSTSSAPQPVARPRYVARPQLAATNGSAAASASARLSSSAAPGPLPSSTPPAVPTTAPTSSGDGPSSEPPGDAGSR